MSPTTPDRPSLLRLAAPLVFSFWFRSAFQWVDTIYASTLDSVGDASIAAIGLTAPFEFLMIACWVGLSNGLTSRLAAAMGAGEGERIDQLLAATRKLVARLRFVFLALAVGIYFLAQQLPLESDVARQFSIYGPVLLGGSALTSFWSVIPDSLVKAHNDTRATMWAGIVSTLTNFLLNTIFVFVFHWGILGIGLATVLARLGGLAYASHAARIHEDRRRALGRDTKPGLFKRPQHIILQLALPASLSFGLLAVEGMAINGMLALHADSAATLAAWSIVDRAARFLTMPVIAIGVALLPLAARLWGAKEWDTIRRELRTGLVWAAAYSLLIALPVTWFFGPQVARALTDAPDSQLAAEQGLRWVFLPVLMGGPMFLLRSTFEGMQQARPGLVVSVVRTFLLLLPLAALGYWMAPRLGWTPVLGLLGGMSAGAGLASLLLGLWMRDFLGSQSPSCRVGRASS